MAETRYIFVGPYAEWVHPGEDFLASDCTEGDEAAWEQLLDGEVLEWNIGMDSGFPFEDRGRRYRRYCCMPGCERPRCTRWPMRYRFSPWEDSSREIATSWVTLDRQGEIDWFRTEFAEELANAARLMAEEPSFHWGLVHWFTP